MSTSAQLQSTTQARSLPLDVSVWMFFGCVVGGLVVCVAQCCLLVWRVVDCFIVSPAYTKPKKTNHDNTHTHAHTHTHTHTPTACHTVYTEIADKSGNTLLGGITTAERCLLRYSTLQQAQQACNTRSDCRSIIMDDGQCNKRYELRKGGLEASVGDTSWQKGGQQGLNSIDVKRTTLILFILPPHNARSNARTHAHTSYTPLKLTKDNVVQVTVGNSPLSYPILPYPTLPYPTLRGFT